MNILHIDASVRTTGSASRALSGFFLDQLRGQGLTLRVDRLDLREAMPAHFGPAQTHAQYLDPAEPTADMQAALSESDRLCDRVLAADALVCGVPIYNFGMPSAFKAFIDHITRSGRTFEFRDAGLVGHLAGKKAVFLVASGGNYRPGAMFDGLDCLTPHIRAVFGFLGLTDLHIIHAHPTQFEGPDIKAKACAEAEAAAASLARSWAEAG